MAAAAAQQLPLFQPFFFVTKEIVGVFFRSPFGDFADRLSSRFTVLTLAVLSAILMATQFWGTPINCWAPAEFPQFWQKFVDNFCFVHGTYYRQLDLPLPISSSERQEHPVIYYQWVRRRIVLSNSSQDIFCNISTSMQDDSVKNNIAGPVSSWRPGCVFLYPAYGMENVLSILRYDKRC